MPPTGRGPGQRSDRNLHDHVIRYLTDASLRSANKDPDFLDENAAERAERFSHFLARRYYRDRLHRGFRHSARLLGSEGAAADAVDTAAFDLILNRCVLGSLATATAVGELVLSALREERVEEWWAELLQYEFAFFVQLATSEPTPPSSFPQRGLSTLVREFQISVPEMLEKIKNRQAPENPQRVSTTLLFSRTQHGRIYVVQLDGIARGVMHAVNGSRQLVQIAECAGVSEEETNRVLTDLIRISAVVPPPNEAP